MNTLRILLMVLLVYASSVGHSLADTRDMTVEFPQSGRPGTVKVLSGEGRVTVTGYKGKDVVIVASSNDDGTFEENEKAKGMKRISGTRFNVESDSVENTIIISRPMNGDVDLDIRIPRNVALKVGGPVNTDMAGSANTIQTIVQQSIQMAFNFNGGGIFNGDVEVSGIDGEIEINTLDGDVVLSDISGSAIVNTLDGDITVVYSKVPGDKPMSFISIDGDVDITFPEKTKATVTASNVDGEVYTDFEMELSYDSSPGSSGAYAKSKVKNKDKGKGAGNTYQQPVHPFVPGMIGQSVTGEINGGGTVILMKTVDGDIYIRSAK